MVTESNQRARWCAEFATILVDETHMSAADALFLAEQVRALSPGLPPSYAVRRALSDSAAQTKRVVAGRLWRTPARTHRFTVEDGGVGW